VSIVTELAAAALALAKQHGLPVFPAWPVRPHGSRLICACPKADNCTSPGKHPMVPHGVTQATTDTERVSYWWRTRPDANIGLATGTVVVIDIDPRHGGDRALAEFESKHYKLPPTWRVATGGAGEHLYFRAPPRRAPIKNSVGQLGPGIDVRGLGGYVIAPPSRHISGQRYRWVCDPQQTLLCTLPPWLAALLDYPPNAKAKPATEWRALVRDEIAEGRRNDTIARLAGHLLRRYVDPHVVLELLLAWNATRCKPPLDHADIVRTVNSIAGKELRRRSA
jgi:Bifunctional DNA primase/polymerase, N-terminal/Primase C terminal 1 (PriCT-1)